MPLGEFMKQYPSAKRVFAEIRRLEQLCLKESNLP
jgi:hypothetical protein